MTWAWRSKAGAALAVGVVAVCVAAANGPKDSAQKSKSAFLSDREVDFIRPGLVIQILGATVDNDGTARYQFKITDPKGVPLDREGIVTPGPVSVSAVLAYIPKGQGIYTAYTTRTQTSPITGDRAVQASADSGGTFTKVSDGVYEYRFNTKVPAGYDRTATHTVAVWASRNLAEFNLGSTPAAKTYNWVPAGDPVTETRHIADNQKCDSCHGQVVAHGSRTTVELCVVCHTPQTTDPDTGNTVDMTTMVHKIHRGKSLPSVVAGKPYVIIGNQQSVHDFSSVVFPADARNCTSCHVEGDKGNQHLTNPSRRACGSCHDDVNFATGEKHANQPQVSDNQCSRCHVPQGELDFDVSILGAHTIETKSAQLSGVKFEILDIKNTTPGERPIVSFAVTDKAGQPLEIAGMGRLALVLAGPVDGNADNGPTISEDARRAPGSGGRYTYTFTAAIPEKANQTWTVGIEGYTNATLLPGTVQQRAVRDAGQNVVKYFPVSSAAAVARRQVVATEKCNVCHAGLSLHGGSRNEVQQCVLCHNPTGTDAARRPADKGAAESINFKEMIHRIHRGEENTRDFTIYGFGGSVNNFNEVRYPRVLSDCGACHVNGSEQLPLRENLAPTTDPRGLFDPAPPTIGACLSCHSSKSAAAHADSNFSPRFGESCATCHGTGAQFAVDKVHAR
ncbi:MAG TPA: OmcA/MtrC family decaheme c-type cytochrome [Bryobacteraceae bacterium]|nr:OmcA/MtrC family decaheme c-type cytochrome [Bryobacteraceae bacterium]